MDLTANPAFTVNAQINSMVIGRAGATTPDVFRFYRPRCDRVVALVLARIADQSGPRTTD